MNEFAREFLQALTREYVERRKPDVGDFLKAWQCNEKAAEKLENKIRKAKGQNAKATAINELRQAFENGEHAALVQGATQRRRPQRARSNSSGSGSGSSSGSDSGSDSGSSEPGDLRGRSRAELDALVDSHIGGCVLREKAREPPPELHTLRSCSRLNRTDEFERFPKSLSAGGVTYIGAENTSDEFLLAVGALTAEIFAEAAGIDVEKQLEVMKHNYCYRATCPISKGGDDGCVEPTLFAEATNSICDRIGQGIRRRQAMEVLEHVLHHVTDVGMHYAFPEEWGLCQQSRLHAAMQEAIAKELYDVSDYDKEESDPKHCLRVKLQEFGYWIITTSWDVQAEFGPWRGTEADSEWKVRTAAELEEKLPLSHALCKDTVARTLVAPKPESLRAFAAFEDPNAASSQSSQSSQSPRNDASGGYPVIV